MHDSIGRWFDPVEFFLDYSYRLKQVFPSPLRERARVRVNRRATCPSPQTSPPLRGRGSMTLGGLRRSFATSPRRVRDRADEMMAGSRCRSVTGRRAVPSITGF